jgi:hypothetical protein
MKKNIFFLLLALLFPCSLLFAANYDDDLWVYALHLEVKQGVLAIDGGEKYPYDLIPMQYDGPTTTEGFDFYGTIVSGKGVSLAQFGFNKPANEVAALGKSVFMVRAPYFANADHVTLYTKGGQKLFNISLKDTSFCNDNNKCNSEIGENYRNCPNDCPAPANLPPPDITPTPENNPPPEILPPPSPVVSPESPENIPVSVPSNTVTEQPTKQSTNNIRITMFIIGILALLLFAILFIRRRNALK